MFNSISRIIINSAIIITPFLAISQVQAGDENSYDSSACAVISGTPTLERSFAMVNNSTTTTLRVRCPLHRDRNHRTLDAEDSFVLVRDHTNVGSVSCTLSNNNLTTLISPPIVNTTTVRAWTRRTGSSSGFQELHFPNGAFRETEAGSWYVACSIPPVQGTNRPSAVSSIYIDED